MTDADFVLKSSSNTEEEKLSGKKLFHKIVTGTISFTTPVRRTEETNPVPLHLHPELKDMAREVVRRIHRIRNLSLVWLLQSLVFLFLSVFLSTINIPTVFFLTAAALTLYFCIWNTVLFYCCDQLIHRRFGEGRQTWKLLLLLPYVNCIFGPYLYKETIRSLRLNRKLRIFCDTLNIILWTSWILLLVLFWLLPSTHLHAVVLYFLTLFCSVVLLVLHTVFQIAVEKIVQRQREEMNLAEVSFKPEFRLRRWGNGIKVFRKKYKIPRTRSEQFSVLNVLLFLILFPVLLFSPIVLTMKIRQEQLGKQLKNAGFHLDGNKIDTPSPPYASDFLPQIQEIGKLTDETMPPPFRDDLYSAGYKKRMKQYLEENQSNLAVYQNMRERKSFGKQSGDVSAEIEEKLQLLERFSILQGALEMKSWNDVFEELMQVENWRSEYSVKPFSWHVLRQFIAGRIRLIPEEKLKEYQHALRRRELREPELRKRELNWLLLSLEPFSKQNPLFRWMNNKEWHNALILAPILPYDYSEQQKMKAEYRKKMEHPALFLSFLYNQSDENFAFDSMRSAFFRIFRTGIALERFHRKYGRDADRLSELVPEFLPAVPLDPFDGKELRFRKGAMTERIRRIADAADGKFTCAVDDRNIHGVRVYSIGRDLTDDGGRHWSGGKGITTHDISFTIPR